MAPEENTGDVAALVNGNSGADLKQIALSLLRLGTTAFGGPAAHIAMMEEEFVRRRGLVSHADFLDMLGASNLVPGPSSTEMAIHIGHQRAGWGGLGRRGRVLRLSCDVDRYGLCVGLYDLRRASSGPELARTAIKNGLLVVVSVLATVAAIAGEMYWPSFGRWSDHCVSHMDQGTGSIQQSPRSTGVGQILAGINPDVGRIGPNRPVGTIRRFSEIWRRHLRKRLRIAGVSSGRSC